MAFSRITVNPKHMGGVPCIRNLHIPVSTVAAMVAEGMSDEQIIARFPELEPEDIRQAVSYVLSSVRDHNLHTDWSA